MVDLGALLRFGSQDEILQFPTLPGVLVIQIGQDDALKKLATGTRTLFACVTPPRGHIGIRSRRIRRTIVLSAAVANASR